MRFCGHIQCRPALMMKIQLILLNTLIPMLAKLKKFTEEALKRDTVRLCNALQESTLIFPWDPVL